MSSATDLDPDLSPTPAISTPLYAPQFDSQQVTDESAFLRWNAWATSDRQIIRIWNVCGQHIMVIPLDWALQAGFKKLAQLETVIDLMFEPESNTPLKWAKKADWDKGKDAGLPLDHEVEPADYVVSRTGHTTTGLIPSYRWGAPPSECSVSTSDSHTSATQSHSSNERTRANTFRRDVLDRDGAECVLTGMKDNLEVARLANRGNKSVSVASELRLIQAYKATAPPNDARLLPADDLQAGVTLYAPLHAMYNRHEAAFYPTVSKEEVSFNGVKSLKDVVTFAFHIFRPPLIHPDRHNIEFVTPIMELHGKKVKWPSTTPPPSTILAQVRYQQTLIKRFAVIKRSMPPPVVTRKRDPSSPTTPRSAKRTRSSTPTDDPEDLA